MSSYGDYFIEEDEEGKEYEDLSRTFVVNIASSRVCTSLK